MLISILEQPKAQLQKVYDTLTTFLATELFPMIAGSQAIATKRDRMLKDYNPKAAVTDDALVVAKMSFFCAELTGEDARGHFLRALAP